MKRDLSISDDLYDDPDQRVREGVPFKTTAVARVPTLSVAADPRIG